MAHTRELCGLNHDLENVLFPFELFTDGHELFATGLSGDDRPTQRLRIAETDCTSIDTGGDLGTRGGVWCGHYHWEQKKTNDYKCQRRLLAGLLGYPSDTRTIANLAVLTRPIHAVAQWLFEFPVPL